MIDRLLSIIAPHSCCGCGNTGYILCDYCKYDIISDMDESCLLCQLPTSVNNLCSSCQLSSGYNGAWYVSHRKDTLKLLIDIYKFKSAIEVANVCVEFLSTKLPVLPDDIVIVPVPTAPAHRRSRGFDHTDMFVRKLAKLRKLPYRQVLERTNNQTQHFKTKTERHINAIHGLRLNGKVPEKVLLVDDIYTTGATIRACTDVLRAGGAKEVYVAVLARQPR